ncbi:MAG TPA: hypothetical protein PJ988_02270 [Anaerolinea sp.]|nr:hypothetical protein [Anaerolinea sp.]
MGLVSHRLPWSRILEFAILITAAVQGVVYVFLYPPWQHYDEPGQFEYAWLVANRSEWPKPGDYDQSMRRDVAASMIEHGFYRDIGGIPNLLLITQPIPIGIAQVGDLPVYYFIASLPLRIFRYMDIDFQLYSVRFVSVFFFLATIWISLRAARELFGQTHPLGWMVPLFMACLPGFRDIMTAVNNDVAAIAFFTLFLYFSFQILRRGLSPVRVAGLIFSVLLCGFTKSTSWLAVPLSVFVLLLGIAHHRKNFPAGKIVLAVVLIAVAFSFSWTNTMPAYFLSASARLPERAATPKAPDGKYALVQGGKSYAPASDLQMLARSELNNISGQTVTLGVWGWADREAKVRFPRLKINGREVIFVDTIQLTDQPKFYAFEASIPENATSGWMSVFPDYADPGNHVFWDGFVLAKGSFMNNPPPVLVSNAQEVEWGGIKFHNGLRNPSVEIGQPAFSNFILSLSQKFSLPVTYAWTLMDIQGSGWYYSASFSRLYRTFWGYFAWGNVPLVGSKPYRLFFVPVVLSIAGILIYLWRRKGRLPWGMLVLGCLAVAIQLALVLLRGAGSWFSYLLLSAARYFFPVMLLVANGLNYGLYNIYRPITAIRKNLGYILIVAYLTGIVVMNGWAWYSIYQFFYRI